MVQLGLGGCGLLVQPTDGLGDVRIAGISLAAGDDPAPDIACGGEVLGAGCRGTGGERGKQAGRQSAGADPASADPAEDCAAAPAGSCGWVRVRVCAAVWAGKGGLVLHRVNSFAQLCSYQAER